MIGLYRVERPDHLVDQCHEQIAFGLEVIEKRPCSTRPAQRRRPVSSDWHLPPAPVRGRPAGCGREFAGLLAGGRAAHRRCYGQWTGATLFRAGRHGRAPKSLSHIQSRRYSRSHTTVRQDFFGTQGAAMSQILERYRLIAMISPLLLLAACSHARTLPIHLAWMYRPISQMKREVKASWTNRPAVLFRRLVDGLRRSAPQCLGPGGAGAQYRTDDCASARGRGIGRHAASTGLLLPRCPRARRQLEDATIQRTLQSAMMAAPRCPHRGGRPVGTAFAGSRRCAPGCGGSRTSVGCHAVAGRV